MRTRIGTIALDYLTQTSRASIGYPDTEALAIIAERAGWGSRQVERIRLELLAALERDERFAKDFTHVEIGGQARKVRSYHPVHTPPPAPQVAPLVLPSDPWRRRQFIGALLDIDPHTITEAHAAAVLAVLPAAMTTLPPRQR